MLTQAALEGIGIAFLPHIVVAEHLDDGTLVQVLPSILKTENRLSVIYAEREFLPAHVRAFVEAIVTWASTSTTMRPRRKQRG